MRSGKYWHLTVKGLAIGLSFLLLTGNPGLYPGDSQWESLFSLAKQKYLERDYKKAIDNLKQLLSFFNKDEQDLELAAKIYLLMGAAYEKWGNPLMAREHFRTARDISDTATVEDIDLESSVEYQRIFLGVEDPQGPMVIARPAGKPRKKKISPLLIAAGVLVVGGVVAALLLTRKKSETDNGGGDDPDYDTRVLGIQWVEVPEGEFMMGDNFNEGDPMERPVHAVYLSKYYISKHEITFEQYDKFCQETNRPKPGDEGWGRGSRPVVNVSLNQAESFCSWLSKKTGKTIMLPSEAQWEKAARGTDQRRYPWGNSAPDCSRANYCCANQTQPVGSFPAGASPYGAHDMAGNAAEWCRDYLDKFFYEKSSYQDPFGPIHNNVNRNQYWENVVRGGSFDCPGATGIRSAERGHHNVNNIISRYGPLERRDLGFRIIREAN